ncbi:MAG: hypothetical protein LBC69_01810 [Eubacteriaceae bacterium]|jgi:uroporphyrinogen-III decarboxylase|nr:hypothetical protein [Eubacteriaceae bacterium]
MGYSLSPKENYLRALQHEPTEYTPCSIDSAVAGMSISIEHGMDNETDGFGVTWTASDSAFGGSLPKPGEFILKDVREWKKAIKFPKIGDYDWEGFAAADLAGINRDVYPVEIFSACCIYERLAAFMGFENALISMAEEPDATFGLLSALADFKCEMIKSIAKYYRPDTYIYFDDVATERNLFMSPKAYRQLIKPLHKKMCQTAIDCGIIPIQHTCGHAEAILDDMIDEGAAAWHAVQPTNDIEEIVQKYGDRFTVIGGYDSNGAPGYESASEEEIRAEVRRCLDTYGKYGKGFIFAGFLLTSVNYADQAAPSSIMADEVMKYRKEREK